MDYQVSRALEDFTRRYQHHWQSLTGHAPASRALFGVPSPCVVGEDDHQVFWQPRQPVEALTLAGVERAMDLQLQPAAWAFYCSQLAGDMSARFQGQSLELLQVWSEPDGVRIQENLIGHLLMQKRLKLPPTLFIATTDSELSLISLSNLTGEILLEEVGRKKRSVLAPSLQDFLSLLDPCVT
ncbi:SecY-interacting protein [Acerihabitans arboris]|uniref:Protein Syd n=1 Tax=Acerihabitans arboris TaxID=2691583 RepID=A0A845SJW9_9GAMM|nr:SecY-interacting protein [Acerihabitans arboris]NDL65543.1 SecY-interacting protein [Acerihabitans arboris]